MWKKWNGWKGSFYSFSVWFKGGQTLQQFTAALSHLWAAPRICTIATAVTRPVHFVQTGGSWPGPGRNRTPPP